MISKKLISLNIALLMVVLSVISMLPISAAGVMSSGATVTATADEKPSDDPDSLILDKLHEPSTNDEFEEDRIIVVIKHKYSVVNKPYDAKEFDPEFFIDVKDLSYINGYDEKEAEKYVNAEKFHQILSLKLRTPGKENVLKGIELLKGCELVLTAEPDYKYYTVDNYTPGNAKGSLIYGDVDLDGKVTVKDATAVQKAVAGIEELNSVQMCLAEPDTYKVTVKSATRIQKHTAALTTDCDKLGKEVTVETTEEREELLYLNADDPVWYLPDSIIIDIKPEFNDYIYTLDDFPEYDFDRIVVKELNTVDLKYAVLYLKEPSHENAVDAVKALMYREGLDVKFVNVSRVAVSC